MHGKVCSELLKGEGNEEFSFPCVKLQVLAGYLEMSNRKFINLLFFICLIFMLRVLQMSPLYLPITPLYSVVPRPSPSPPYCLYP